MAQFFFEEPINFIAAYSNIVGISKKSFWFNPKKHKQKLPRSMQQKKACSEI